MWEPSYNELAADRELAKEQMPSFDMRGRGRIRNNRRTTRGRKRQRIVNKITKAIKFIICQ